MAALPEVDDKRQELLSGAEASVSIPIAASSYSGGPDNDDARPHYDTLGFQLHAWSHPLKSADDRCGTPRECRYSYLPCFPMAQIESRLGIASYNASLAFYCSIGTLQLLFTLLLTLCLEWFWMYIAVLPLVGICVASLLVMLGLSGLLKMRTMAARRHIRERFLIPGDDADDRSVINWHEAQAIRQMARHVQCDRTKMTERVETVLPAYPLH